MSRAYLRHLHLAGEMTAATLLTIHNLAFYLDTLRRDRGRVSVWVDSRSSDRRCGRGPRPERELKPVAYARLDAPENAPAPRQPKTRGRPQTMPDPRMLLALAGLAPAGEAHPFGSLILMALIFGIFYFVLIMPMQQQAEEARGAGPEA